MSIAVPVTLKDWKKPPNHVALRVLNRGKVVKTVNGIGGTFSSVLKRAKVDDVWVL